MYARVSESSRGAREIELCAALIGGYGVVNYACSIQPKEATMYRTGRGRFAVRSVGLATALVAMSAGSAAQASTITQNTSWTINRAGTSAKYRVVAYGDSIYAGYRGSLSRVAKRAAPQVAGEYASQAWDSDIEVIRRAK
jgi:hypothetical protein